MKTIWRLLSFQGGRNHGFWIWVEIVSTALCIARVFFGKAEGMSVENWTVMTFVVGAGFTGTNLAKVWFGAKYGETGIRAVKAADKVEVPKDAPAA